MDFDEFLAYCCIGSILIPFILCLIRSEKKKKTITDFDNILLIITGIVAIAYVFVYRDFSEFEFLFSDVNFLAGAFISIVCFYLMLGQIGLMGDCSAKEGEVGIDWEILVGLVPCAIAFNKYDEYDIEAYLLTGVALCLLAYSAWRRYKRGASTLHIVMYVSVGLGMFSIATVHWIFMIGCAVVLFLYYHSPESAAQIREKDARRARQSSSRRSSSSGDVNRCCGNCTHYYNSGCFLTYIPGDESNIKHVGESNICDSFSKK